MDPIAFSWDGEALRPLSSYWSKKADENLVVGERYLASLDHERSAASHRHYFAAIAEAYMNLPEAIATRFANPEQLRKFSLMMTGHRDERSIVCSSKAEANRLAAFIRPMDATAIVSVAEGTVVVWTAKSQSYRAMGKRAFAQSKDDVLSYLAELTHTTPEQLQKERAA
jgi:hypothetical protein